MVTASGRSSAGVVMTTTNPVSQRSSTAPVQQDDPSVCSGIMDHVLSVYVIFSVAQRKNKVEKTSENLGLE